MDITKEVILCILPTKLQPTGLLWQDGPLLWIHPRISPGKTIEYYPTAVATLALQGLQTCVQHFGALPDKLITPYDASQVKILRVTIDDWAIVTSPSIP